MAARLVFLLALRIFDHPTVDQDGDRKPANVSELADVVGDLLGDFVVDGLLGPRFLVVRLRVAGVGVLIGQVGGDADRRIAFRFRAARILVDGL